MNIPKGPKSLQVISTLQFSRPFLTKKQLSNAYSKTISNNTSYKQRKNHIFQFLLKIITSLRFPTRVVETAMNYFQRYYLFSEFEAKDAQDVGIVCLFLSIKNDDTVKKLKDIIIIANQVRSVPMSSSEIDQYKKVLLGIELKILECISFDLRVGHIEEFIVKFVKTIKQDKEIANLSWLISFDSFQTDLSLRFGNHTIGIGCIFLALKIKQIDFKIEYNHYYAEENDVFEVVQELLDFYINSYNYSCLINFYPELPNLFLEIKLSLPQTNSKNIESVDDYFDYKRDFTIGERRYVNNKKRVFNELGE